MGYMGIFFYNIPKAIFYLNRGDYKAVNSKPLLVFEKLDFRISVLALRALRPARLQVVGSRQYLPLGPTYRKQVGLGLEESYPKTLGYVNPKLSELRGKKWTQMMS